MSAIDNRLRKLEEQADEGEDWLPWRYWDSYSPEEREAMGQVRWIVLDRPGVHIILPDNGRGDTAVIGDEPITRPSLLS